MDRRIRHLRNYADKPRPVFSRADSQFLLDLATELKRFPIYITEAPPDCPRGVCRAFATRMPIPSVRQQLVERGEWKGAGNVIVYWPDEHANREDWTGLAIHEVAHLLPQPDYMPADRDYTIAEIECNKMLVTEVAALPPKHGKACWGHDDKFTRIVLHLHYRAQLQGVEIPLPALHCAGARYNMSGLWRYQRALANEPSQMLDADFTTILASPAPEAFTELYQQDMKGTE